MHVGLYLVNGVFDTGLAVVADILTTANALLSVDDVALEPWTVTLLGASSHTRTGAGLTASTTPVGALTGALDLLVVPAMSAKEPERVLAAVVSEDTQTARRFIAASHDAGVRVAAACTSTFLLAEAGVLAGLTATTSWWLGPVFRKRYPDVHLDETRMLVSQRGVTTAGAAFGHIDLALSIVMSRSPAVAESVARHLLLDFRTTQAAYAMPTLLASHHPVVAEFERWVRTHLDKTISISQAAKALAVSERTLQRSVAQTLGMSPMEFVQELRIDQAVHLLRTTTLAAGVIGRRVGYQNAATLRQLIRRRRNTTLSAIRRRHATSLLSTD